MSVSKLQIAPNGFFSENLKARDPEIFAGIGRELSRQQRQIELIASENIVSRAVLEANGSVLTNKYAEGYPGRRYYGGCEFVDQVEELAIARAKELFNCQEANVQPHSGSQANQAVFMALMKPGDTFLGMDLAAGGHLTHGGAANQSGKWFNAVHYSVGEEDHRIDYDAVARLADEHRPKIIIAGGSAYSRIIDFKKFREIADSIGAKLMVDMAHFAGLVAAGVHPNPLDHAHVVTSTTHKTLRGPRGGLVLTNDGDLAKKIRSSVFPGIQGGPLMHVVAAKAVAFGEALEPSFKAYGRAVIDNAQALAASLVGAGYAVISGGTDTHLALIDLRPKGVKGNAAEQSLERAGMTCNKNGVPFDPEKFTVTSGIRVGSPAATTRGFGVSEFREVGALMAEVLDGLAAGDDNSAAEEAVAGRVEALTTKFPIYG
ncbi:Serine hydroxymethyltransferase [hydrothermal vent metagenome]|uniref:Serine hydroxymethyltransferase n=1 Tax=hydrothermal vent metagenome TaxID=652676 RepID=A0A3B0SDJ3_9ZZZZ